MFYHLIWYALDNYYRNTLGPPWPPHVKFMRPGLAPPSEFYAAQGPPYNKSCEGGAGGGAARPPMKNRTNGNPALITFNDL